MNCPTDHKHAEVSTCYIIHKCRCEPCTTAQRDRARVRRRAQLYGRWVDPYVDAAPVRAHIYKLQEAGLGWKRIAELSGVGNTAVSQLIYGRKGSTGDPRKGEELKRVLAVKAEKILAVKPELSNLCGGANVPSRGFVRRVQALVAVGWSLSKIARRLGVSETNMGPMLQRPTVSARYFRRMVDVYDELWNVLPPHEEWRDLIAYRRSLRLARERGWVPPLAWDDIDADVVPPVAESVAVDPVAVELALSGVVVRLSHDERREIVRRGVKLRLSDAAIGALAGLASRTVFRIRGELGLASPLEAGQRVAA
jgi:hypothetical protein